MRGRACWVGAVLVVLISCVGSMPIERVPTPEAPTVACIADTPFAPFQARGVHGDRILPEIVHIIGVTPPEDGERLMIIRGAYIPSSCAGANLYDRAKCDWQPWPREKIQTRGCGPEAAALLELAAGS